jgi:hypothetical protein
VFSFKFLRVGSQLCCSFLRGFEIKHRQGSALYQFSL